MTEYIGKKLLTDFLQAGAALKGYIEGLEVENARLKNPQSPLAAAKAVVGQTKKPPQQAQPQQAVVGPPKPRPTVIPAQPQPQQGQQGGTIKPIAPAAIIDTDVAHPPAGK